MMCHKHSLHSKGRIKKPKSECQPFLVLRTFEVYDERAVYLKASLVLRLVLTVVTCDRAWAQMLIELEIQLVR